MEISLSQLSMLIELTEREIKRIKHIIDDPSSTDEEADNCGELSMQYLSLSSTLAQLYKNKWPGDSGQPTYDDLTDEIQKNT
ncbi:MAG: hypothetical protein RL497_118 [Pseudomonadota bacterium]|jgi:hypothetical protein